MDEAKCAYAGETIKQVHHSLQAAWLEGAGDPSRACHVCAGEVAGARSPASSAWWPGFFTPFMERGLVLGLEAPEVLCLQDSTESYLEYPLGCMCVCARTHV